MRAAKGWSGYALAHAAGITPTMVKKIEDGATPNPTIGTVAAIARALGVEIGELVAALPPVEIPESAADVLAPEVIVPLEPDAALARSTASAALEVVTVEDAARLVEESLAVFREALKRAGKTNGPPKRPRPKSGVRKRFSK